jgi:hypothetical protein
MTSFPNWQRCKVKPRAGLSSVLYQLTLAGLHDTIWPLQQICKLVIITHSGLKTHSCSDAFEFWCYVDDPHSCGLVSGSFVDTQDFGTDLEYTHIFIMHQRASCRRTDIYPPLTSQGQARNGELASLLSRAHHPSKRKNVTTKAPCASHAFLILSPLPCHTSPSPHS